MELCYYSRQFSKRRLSSLHGLFPFEADRWLFAPSRCTDIESQQRWLKQKPHVGRPFAAACLHQQTPIMRFSLGFPKIILEFKSWGGNERRRSPAPRSLQVLVVQSRPSDLFVLPSWSTCGLGAKSFAPPHPMGALAK